MGNREIRIIASVFAISLCPPTSAQVTQRVSVDSGGTQGNASSNFPAISTDNRFVAFSSYASNLVAGDANGACDVFVRDRWSGTTECVSVGLGGVPGNADSGGNNAATISISADGRFVAFASLATNLVANDMNGFKNVFIRDRQTGTTERAAQFLGNSGPNGDSLSPSISADGRFVAFESAGSDIVFSDTNMCSDIFVLDRQSGTIQRVSVSTGGTEADFFNHNPRISADGRYVAFESAATNFDPADTNGVVDIYVHDRQSGTTELVSTATGGTLGNADSVEPSISSDGRFVAFGSDASNLVAGDTNGSADIYWHDRQSGATERASVATGGTGGNSFSFSSSISADGRWVAFSSVSTNLVGGDTNAVSDIFVRDRQSSTTVRVSVSTGGAQANNGSAIPSISPDGRFVAFWGLASNLVAGDTNASNDVFVHDSIATGITSLCDPGIAGVIACPCSNPASGAGRGCNNSDVTGGAALSASGISYLSADSLVFTTSGEKSTATSIVLQGTSVVVSGMVYGQGVRCVGGTLKRLFTKTASGGSITAPNFGAGDPTVSARSAAKGDPISAGQSRWYLVFYRDPVVLGGCPAPSTFNASQTGRVDWMP